MKVEQVYEHLNAALQETLGETAVLNEDLSNIVDMGNLVFDANAVDPITKNLINRIGREVYVNRILKMTSPNVFKDSWEYGSIRMKVRTNLPESSKNETWDLNDGQSYDPNIFKKTDAFTRYWNKRVTFEIKQSITEKQIKQSFTSAGAMAAFLGMIQTAIENRFTCDLHKLAMDLYTNFIGETLYTEYNSGDTFTGASHNKAINLLYLYNTQFGKQLTADECIYDKEFIRFACYVIGKYVPRLETMSTLFNISETEKFTPRDRMHILMLSDFKKAADIYLQSDTFNDEFTRMPDAEEIAYWQGTGTDYGFDSVSKIHVTTNNNHEVECGGILCVMHDSEALGICCEERRTTSNFNPVAEFTNYWHKFDAEYFNDPDENFIVFFVA